MDQKPRFYQRTELILDSTKLDPQHDWVKTDLPDKERWYEVFSQLFSGAGVMTYLERAQRLSFYGWTPHDLEFVCSNPRNLTVLDDAEATTEDFAESLAALTQEAVTYYSNGLGEAMHSRATYMARLNQLGWSFAEIGRLVGVSKQRVHRVIESVSTKPPNTKRN